jgi:hypothetical protein
MLMTRESWNRPINSTVLITVCLGLTLSDQIHHLQVEQENKEYLVHNGVDSLAEFAC